MAPGEVWLCRVGRPGLRLGKLGPSPGEAASVSHAGGGSRRPDPASRGAGLAGIPHRGSRGCGELGAPLPRSRSAPVGSWEVRRRGEERRRGAPPVATRPAAAGRAGGARHKTPRRAVRGGRAAPLRRPVRARRPATKMAACDEDGHPRTDDEDGCPRTGDEDGRSRRQGAAPTSKAGERGGAGEQVPDLASPDLGTVLGRGGVAMQRRERRACEHGERRAWREKK